MSVAVAASAISRRANRFPVPDPVEDAGCTDVELLGNLRSPGPHVRRCWALDLVLGKRHSRGGPPEQL
jgi:hypothetical protein